MKIISPKKYNNIRTINDKYESIYNDNEIILLSDCSIEEVNEYVKKNNLIIKGYEEVDENEYSVYCTKKKDKKIIALFIILEMLIMTSIISIYLLFMSKHSDIKYDSKAEIEQSKINMEDLPIISLTDEKNANEDYLNSNITFSGYSDSLITKDYPNIYLSNNGNNLCYFVYELYVNNEKIYTTNFIEPSDKSAVPVDLYSLLNGKPGIYNLKIVPIPYGGNPITKWEYNYEQTIKIQIK